MKGTTFNMNPTKFVKLWLTPKTTDTIAKELGVSNATVYTYASKLRGLGVNLPKRTVNRSTSTTINVEALNELIEESR
jgi:transposase